MILQWLLLASAMAQAAVVSAGEVRLRNGTVIRGKPVPLQTLGLMRSAPAGPIAVHSILMMDNGWQRYFVPKGQVPAEQINLDADLARYETFEFEQVRRGGLAVKSVGAFQETIPWSEVGHRTVTLTNSRGEAEPVIQAITSLSPQYAGVTSLTHLWEFGIATSALPQRTVDGLLKRVTDPLKPGDRFSVARFYIQAEQYSQARQALEGIARDFPEEKERVDQTLNELTQLQAQRLLAELRRRRGAGQHRLAVQAALQFPEGEVGPAAMREARAIVSEYDEARDRAEKAIALLGELQSTLEDDELASAAAGLRSLVREQLDYENLDRLNPFLRFATDDSLTAEEKLGFAYSGWLLGEAHADGDLRRAANLWQARFLILQYLRSESDADRASLLEQIEATEGVTAETVAQLIPLLPPALEMPPLAPGVVGRIEVTPADAELPVAYSVMLPLDYHPQHQYPLVVALRPAERTDEQMLDWWSGSSSRPGPAQRYGYVVITPEYSEPNQPAYEYSATAHHVVIESIRDACRRLSINADRIFLAGHGMGGDAAFDIGMSHPDLFAGVIPICGECDQYCKYYWENARHTAWYVVGGELDRDLVQKNAVVLERFFRDGTKHDIIYVEFKGRGYEDYYEEVHRLFDWMDLHQRARWSSDFEMSVLRATDNRFYWLVAEGLPRNVILGGRVASRVGQPMHFEGKITPGNTIYASTGAERHTIYLAPELIDFDARLKVHVARRQRFSDFVRPDIGVMLEDYRTRGDRTKLYWARLDF